MQALVRRFSAVQQLRALSFFDKRILNIFINRLHRTKFLNQSHGGFFSDARHTRNIVRRITHQCFEIDHVNRIKAILLAEYIRCVFCNGGLTLARDGQQNAGSAADQLQGVFISGYNQTGISMVICLPAQCAEQIIRFKSCLFHIWDSHRVQHFPNERKLLRQFVRHTLSCSLVLCIFFMPKGLFSDVKAYHNTVRLVLVL